MKHVQLHAHADHTFVTSLVPGAGKLPWFDRIRAGEWAENSNVKECLLKPATIEPAGSDVQPSVAVGGCTTKPEVLASEWQ